MKNSIRLLIVITSLILPLSCALTGIFEETELSLTVSEIAANWNEEEHKVRVSWRPPNNIAAVEYYIVTLTDLDRDASTGMFNYVVERANSEELRNGKQEVDIYLEKGRYDVSIAVKHILAVGVVAGVSAEDIVPMVQDNTPPSPIINFQVIDTVLPDTNTHVHITWGPPKDWGFTADGSSAAIESYAVYLATPIIGDKEEFLNSIEMIVGQTTDPEYYPQPVLNNGINIITLAADSRSIKLVGIPHGIEYSIEVFARNSVGLWGKSSYITVENVLKYTVAVLPQAQ